MKHSDALARVSRLFAIVTVLRSRKPHEHIGREHLAGVCRCTPKTIQRDTEFLAEAGVPIVYDRARHSYVLPADTGWTYPVAKLTIDDLLALAVARAWILQSTSTRSLPFSAEIDAALAKATAPFTPSQNELFQSVFAATAEIHGMARDYSRAPSGLLYQACVEHRSVRILYESRGSAPGEPSERLVDPYRIDRRDGQYLELQAFCHKRQSMRTFALDRIHEATLTEETFTLHPGLLDDDGVVGGLRGGERIVVKVLFDAETAMYAKDKRWPFIPTFTDAPDGCGGVIMTGEVMGTEGFVKYILSWGQHATVLGGPELKLRVEEELRAMVKNYRK